MLTPILVVISDGVVESATICKDGDSMEQLFIRENYFRGRKTNIDEMDDGYVELEDCTICMVWAESES